MLLGRLPAQVPMSLLWVKHTEGAWEAKDSICSAAESFRTLFQITRVTRKETGVGFLIWKRQ